MYGIVLVLYVLSLSRIVFPISLSAEPSIRFSNMESPNSSQPSQSGGKKSQTMRLSNDSSQGQVRSSSGQTAKANQNATANTGGEGVIHYGEKLRVDNAQYWRKQALEGGATPRFTGDKAYTAEPLYNLALCYWGGDGVPQNSKEAVELFKKSAEMGNLHSIGKLALAYHDGRGVPKNIQEEYMWQYVRSFIDANPYTELYNGGDGYSMKQYESEDQTPAAQVRNLEPQLTPLQVSNAQARAKQFMECIKQNK